MRVSIKMMVIVGTVIATLIFLNMLFAVGFNEVIPPEAVKKCHAECSLSMNKMLEKLELSKEEIKGFDVPQKCLTFCAEALERKYKIPLL